MRVYLYVLSMVVATSWVLVAAPAAAAGRAGGVEGGQAGEDRWVPSFSISSGLVFQNQQGFADSFQTGTNNESLQGVITGSDLLVEPFVGPGLELMSPALPIPTRPRFFLGGEFLPTFSSDHEVALQGNPDCIRGPRLFEPCTRELTGIPIFTFAEIAAQGQGVSTTTTYDMNVFGAYFGVAFPAQIYRRQLRIKPYLAWINYQVDSQGMMVDAECQPPQPPPAPLPLRVSRCTPTQIPGQPVVPGFLREITLSGSDSQLFNAIGPGLDIELDVVRYRSWLGVSLFAGARAYRTLGNLSLEYSASQTYSDQLGTDTAVANWEVEIAPWMYRAHVGIRFQWLGLRD